MNIVQMKALLKRWKTKIDLIPTNRKGLKAELLSLVTVEAQDTEDRIKEKYESFIAKRNRLLSENHGQGFTWTSHFKSLWDWLSYLLPASWRPFPGSQLRQALLDAPTLPAIGILNESALPKQSIEQPLGPQINFEEALLETPALALADVYYQLDALPHFLEGGVELSLILKQLDLLKTSIDPQVYYRLLEKLYQRQPIESLSYFYHLYQLDPKEVPDPYEFIEQHLWVKTILDLFVRHSTDHNFQTHTIQLLLILLSSVPMLHKPHHALFKNEGKNEHVIDFFGELFEQWSKKPTQCPANALTDIYNTYTNNIRNQIPLDKNTKQSRKLNSNFSVSQLEGQDYLRILEDIHEYINPPLHPLLKHLARQAAEQLLARYYGLAEDERSKICHPGHQGAETLRLISQLLQTNILFPLQPNTFLKGLDPYKMPMISCSDAHHNFQIAERYAVEIILGAIQNTEMALIAAHHVRQKYLQNPTPFLIDWIVKRVEYFNPKAIPALRYILGEVTIYGIEDLPSHEITHFPYTPSELIEHIDTQFAKFHQAHKEYKASEENEASLLLFNQLNQLLNHPGINSTMLETASRYIDDFKNYLTDSLKVTLGQQITQKQNELCRWELSTLGVFEIGSRVWGLQQVEDKKGEAVLASHKKEYNWEYLHSQEAVNAFAHILDTMETPDIKFLRQASNTLDSLENYLTTKQYSDWKNKIGELIFNCKRATSPANSTEGTVRTWHFFQAPTAEINLHSLPKPGYR